MDETYYGGVLPEVVANGSAWKHRQAVKRDKGRQVANAVRNGRDKFSREISGYLPITGDIRFISNLIGDIKDGDAMSSLPWLLVAALPGIAKKAARPLARKTSSNAVKRTLLPTNNAIKREQIAMKDGVPYILSNGPTQNYKYTGGGEHISRLIDGSWQRTGLSKFPIQHIRMLYSPYNMESPASMEALMKKFSGLDANDLKKALKRELDKSFVNFNDYVNFYRGSKLTQSKFDGSLPHEVHHGLMQYSRKQNTLKRDFPPVDIPFYQKEETLAGRTDNERKIVLDYFLNKENQYDELAARGTQILDYMKITDSKRKITGDELHEAVDRYLQDPNTVKNNMREFKNIIGDNWDGMANWINRYSTMLIPGAIGGLYGTNK